MQDLRRQRQVTAALVIEEYQRTGTVPAELIRWVQEEVATRGRLLTTEQARVIAMRYAVPWVQQWMEAKDREKAAQHDSPAARRARGAAKMADILNEQTERATHRPRVMITKE